MLTILNKKMTVGLVALSLVAAPFVAPVAQANAEAKQKQVFCNIEGNSGKWKAQIGGPSTEHEYPLLVDGKTVFVQSQSKVDSSLDATCKSLYGTPVSAHEDNKDDKEKEKPTTPVTGNTDNGKKDDKKPVSDAGKGKVDTTPTATTDAPVVPAELPRTGVAGLQGILAALAAAGATYGSALIAQRKKNLL